MNDNPYESPHSNDEASPRAGRWPLFALAIIAMAIALQTVSLVHWIKYERFRARYEARHGMLEVPQEFGLALERYVVLCFTLPLAGALQLTAIASYWPHRRERERLDVSLFWPVWLIPWALFAIQLL